MRTFITAAIALFVSVPHAIAQAPPYPSKPIKFVVPFGPGSASDALGRIAAHDLSQAIGQPVVVINKAGADGSLSATEVKRAAPDGTTFLFGSNSPLAVVPHLRKDPPYDVLTDFTPVTFLGVNSIYIVVSPSVPAKTLIEFIAHAKAHPKALNYATGNTFAIVGTSLFAANAGIEMQHIPYKSEPDAIVDLLSGRIQFMMGTFTTVSPHVNGGKLRVLASTHHERNPLWPDVPSIVEAGQPKFPFDPWFALVGPAGLPPDIVAYMNKAMASVLAKPSVREQMLKQGFSPKSSTPEELAVYLKDQLAVWKTALTAAGVEPQ